MKRAFVLRLSPDAEPLKRNFRGHVEEVDTGREMRFSSLEEFLAFLQKCVTDTPDAGSTGKPPGV